MFGGRLRFAVSGGGPLGERLTHFFNGIGVRIFEGYGLTETSPTLTLGSADAWRPGTVGRPLAGTTIRIADDGEILAKGPQVFQGYWNAEAATAETFDADGWFRTGDIGELDADGYLRITGRKKELIVTAAGKNVAPAPLEDRLRAHPLVSQAVVVGDQRPFVAAMLALDHEALDEWAGRAGLDGLATAGAADPRHAARRAAGGGRRGQPLGVQGGVHPGLRRPAPRPVHRLGRAHPTLKVRRAVVVKTYGGVIEELYG